MEGITMKKFMLLLLASAILLTFAACGNASEQQEIPQNIETPEEKPEEESAEEPTEEPEEKPEEEIIEDPFALWDFSALELVGYYFNDDNRLTIDTEGWVEIDSPDIIREFFHGTWERSNGTFLFVDDTMENDYFWLMCDGFYKVGDNVIVSSHWDMAEPNYYYWIDISKPDIMFSQANWVVSPQAVTSYETNYLTKTDTPPSQPEDGFLTWFREWEITTAYGINPEMLTSVEFHHEESGHVLNREARWHPFNINLISEAPEKLVFNVPLDDCVGMAPVFWADATVTLEKINGEWIRTIEVNEVTRIQFIDNEWVYTVETV
jgi:hypothetical protein